MRQKSNYWGLAVAIFLSSAILANAYKYKYKAQETIVVTGLGETEFESDLIVWECNLDVETQSVELGYKELEEDKKVVKEFIASMGIAESDVTYKFVNVMEMTEPVYNANGNYTGQKFKCHKLTQSMTIESKDIEKVERMTREISSLIAQGITVRAYSPSYYYTKLDDVKLTLIEKASADARQRAEKIAVNSGADLGGVQSARMGVFQITGTNSNDAYEAGGSFNVMDKDKKARITMRIEYRVK